MALLCHSERSEESSSAIATARGHPPGFFAIAQNEKPRGTTTVKVAAAQIRMFTSPALPMTTPSTHLRATESRPLVAALDRPGWLWLALALMTFVVYHPALHGNFIWDDQPGHVTKPELQSLAGLGRIWFEIGATQQYYPVLHSAFWLEHRLWGDAPFGYHLVNVLLHATAACLFGTILRRLKVPGAVLAAWVFALHTVCVESVAWITEQKNTLSTALYLAAALTYLRFDDNRRRPAYLVATGF